MFCEISRYVKSSLADVVVRFSQSRWSCLELSCCCFGNCCCRYRIESYSWIRVAVSYCCIRVCPCVKEIQTRLYFRDFFWCIYILVKSCCFTYALMQELQPIVQKLTQDTLLIRCLLVKLRIKIIVSESVHLRMVSR